MSHILYLTGISSIQYSYLIGISYIVYPAGISCVLYSYLTGIYSILCLPGISCIQCSYLAGASNILNIFSIYPISYQYILPVYLTSISSMSCLLYVIPACVSSIVKGPKSPRWMDESGRLVSGGDHLGNVNGQPALGRDRAARRDVQD